MWIVLLDDNTRHSAWLSRRSAVHQFEVVQDHGMASRSSTAGDNVVFDATVSCEDGHYYV